ncbi:unnamed protein product [Prunus armeniaca]
MVSTQFHARVKVFRTNNGGEYANNTLASFFLAQGIIHQMTTPFTPQQNGVSERKNRQLLEVGRSLVLDMSVPHHLWRYAVLSAAYLINRTPNRILDFKTPHDVFGDHVSPVSVSKLPPKMFGCVSYGEKGSELESLRLENDVIEDTAIKKETTYRTEASDRLPISGDEVGALGVETTGHTEASDQLPIYENNDSDSCMDEFDAIPPSALLVPQSTRDSEPSELPPQTTHGKPKVQYFPDIHAKSKYPISHYVSTNRLSKSYASYLSQLSSVCVPTKLHDALSNPCLCLINHGHELIEGTSLRPWRLSFRQAFRRPKSRRKAAKVESPWPRDRSFEGRGRRPQKTRYEKAVVGTPRGLRAPRSI